MIKCYKMQNHEEQTTYFGASIRPLIKFLSITTLNPPTSIVPFIITKNIAPNIINDCTTSVKNKL